MNNRGEKFKVRKKPVVVEAQKIIHNTIIKTLEGEMAGFPGDYIITGVRGEQYPIKADIFEETYERAATPPGDMDAAEIERLESAINEAYCREGDDGVPLVRDLLQAALAAARGNRAELEAAAREAVAEACEFCRYGKKELPGRRDYCKSEHCQWLKIIDALAALVKAEEVKNDG